MIRNEEFRSVTILMQVGGWDWDSQSEWVGDLISTIIDLTTLIMDVID